MISRILVVAALGVTALGSLATARVAPGPKAPEVLVYKDPNCGCCNKWVEHLKANGFVVTTRDQADLKELKTTLGVPASLTSCHTAIVGGYVIEGHVPADLISKLLRTKPKIVGLAVPGMPIGAPGMEGEPKVRYDVIAFKGDGSSEVFEHR